MTAAGARQTLDQQRAAHAWKAAERAENELRNKAKSEFGAPAKKLGPRILTSGLGPAVQFLIAKRKKDERTNLESELQAWLLDEGPTKAMRVSRLAPAEKPGAALIDNIINSGSDRLRWLTAEALAYLAWLTRFCEARGWTDDEQ